MTATPNRKPSAKRAPKPTPAAEPTAKREAPTALHRESPFGPAGGAIYFNSVKDRWYAQAWIVTLDGEHRSKTATARSRDDAYDALVKIRSEQTLAIRGQHEEEPAPAKAPRRRTGRRSDADLVFVPGVGTVLPAKTAPAKKAAAKKAAK